MQNLEKNTARISRALSVAVLLCFLMLATSAVIVLAVSRAASRADNSVVHTLEVKQTLAQLLAVLNDAESAQRGYLITGKDSFLEAVAAGRALAPQHLDTLAKRVSDNPVQFQRVSALKSIVTERVDTIVETITLTQQGRKAEAVTIVGTRGSSLMQQIRTRIREIDAEEDVLLLKRRAQAAQARDRLVTATISLAVICGIFAVFALLSVRAYVRAFEESRRRLQNYHNELEARVAERTAELARSTELATHERSRAEALLTDVNHRVGNNLALVSSFLTMQQRAVKHPEAAKALGAARARVQAIASAHRKLRLGADFATVKANEVLGAVLEDICAGLPWGGQIRINYDLAPLEIQARDAVSLGVLTSELVMNAVKHAFTAGQSGEVGVVFSSDGAGPPYLEVTDDGVGWYEEQASAREQADGGYVTGGLGTRIIEMVARQFGSMPQRSRYRADSARPGTRVRIELERLQLAQPA